MSSLLTYQIALFRGYTVDQVFELKEQTEMVGARNRICMKTVNYARIRALR